MGMIYQIHLLYQLILLLHSLAGSIQIDNQNIQNIRLQSLRRHVGVVSQDIVSDSCICILLHVCRTCTSVHDAHKNLKCACFASLNGTIFTKLLGAVWQLS